MEEHQGHVLVRDGVALWTLEGRAVAIPLARIKLIEWGVHGSKSWPYVRVYIDDQQFRHWDAGSTEEAQRCFTYLLEGLRTYYGAAH